MAKILCVLYDDPVDGLPDSSTRGTAFRSSSGYPDGQTLPTPSAIDFTPGELLGSVSGELGLRSFLEGQGHELVVTSDKDGEDSEFDRHLADAEVVISQPFWPAYLTAERIAKAPNLKLAVTAGIGSDHVDLDAAIANGDHRRRGDLLQQHQRRRARGDDDPLPGRNYLPSHQWVLRRRLEHRRLRPRSYDLEGMDVGTVAAGRIGLAVLRRLAPVRRPPALHRQAPAARGGRAGAEPDLPRDGPATWCRPCDVVTVNAPLHPETRGLFDDELIGTMKRGAYLINTARGLIGDRDAVVRALECGQLAGYAGDVWYPQPAPADHPWRTMPHHGMTPHISGSSLSAQARYAAGTREILESYFAGTGRSARST